jgi:predicted aspartyl protease
MKPYLSLLVVFTAMCLSLVSNAQPVVFPFVFNDGDILVDAKINGRTVRLCFDTGSPTLYLRDDICDKLGLRLPSTTSVPRFKNIASLWLGKVVWKNISRYENFEQKFLPGFEGLLGMDLLKDYAVGIDLDKKQLTFWRQGKRTAEQIAAYLKADNPSALIHIQPLAIDIQDNLTTTIQLDHRKVEMILDTGATTTILDSATAEEFTPLRQGGSWITKTLEEDAEMSRHLLRSMQIGQMTLDYPPMWYWKEVTVAKPFVNLLGMDVLARTRFVLDFPALQLRFVRRTPQWDKLESLLRQAGIDLLRNNIYATLNDTAATQAKLPRRGSLLQVNGIPFAKLKASETLSAELLKASRLELLVADGSQAKPRRFVVSLAAKLATPPPQLNASLPILSSDLPAFKNVTQPYSASVETPIEVPPGGNIVARNDLLFVENPPTGNYPYGATAYTKAYKGDIPDAPASRRKVLRNGTVVISHPPPAR